MISADDLPDPNDRAAIVAFARTFNGYEHFGSFEACAEAANKKKRDSLGSVRNELFFAYRAGNHTGDEKTIVTAYAELLPFLKKLISQPT